MASSYKESLATAQRVFGLLIVILTNESVRARSKAQLLSVIKDADVANATALGEVVRGAIIDMADQAYNNGVNLVRVDGIIQRIRRDGNV